MVRDSEMVQLDTDSSNGKGYFVAIYYKSQCDLGDFLCGASYGKILQQIKEKFFPFFEHFFEVFQFS